MGLFGNASPFDADVEKATSENNTAEEWGLIMEICDKAASSTTNAKDCLRSIIKRLGQQDPHIVVQAITLLDACVNNCGKTFHLEIASREFETEFRRLLSKAQPEIAKKFKLMLKKWAENEFKSDPQLNLIPSLIGKLKSEGMDFGDAAEKASKKAAPSTANKVQQKEEEDLAKAIELSLQETKQGSKSTSGPAGKTLYPSMNHVSSAPPPPVAQQQTKKVRALYDFEAAEDNELTFKTGEIIHVTDSSDPNWWKGHNHRGEGLFPSNFVTSDLTEPEPRQEIARKSVQFAETETAVEEEAPAAIDETKIDRCLALLNEANTEDDGSNDNPEMLQLEHEVYRMGPLIDQALEKADRQHAQLTQLSSDLVESLNLYHSLMREPSAAKPFPPAPYMPPPPHFAPPPQHPAYHQGPMQQLPPQMYANPTPYSNMAPIPPFYAQHMQQQQQSMQQQMGQQQQPMPSGVPMSGMPTMPMSMGANMGMPGQMHPAYNPSQTSMRGRQMVTRLPQEHNTTA